MTIVVPMDLRERIIENGALTVLADFHDEIRPDGSASIRLIQMLEASIRELSVDKAVSFLLVSASKDVLSIAHDQVENLLGPNRKLTMFHIQERKSWVQVMTVLSDYLRNSVGERKFDGIFLDGGYFEFTELTDWAGLARELKDLGGRHGCYTVLSRPQIKPPRDVELESV